MTEYWISSIHGMLEGVLGWVGGAGYRRRGKAERSEEGEAIGMSIEENVRQEKGHQTRRGSNET